MAVHSLSASSLSVGWKEIKVDPPKQGETVRMMDKRGVIVQGTWHPHATYSYEGKIFNPTHWTDAEV